MPKWEGLAKKMSSKGFIRVKGIISRFSHILREVVDGRVRVILKGLLE